MCHTAFRSFLQMHVAGNQFYSAVSQISSTRWELFGSANDVAPGTAALLRLHDVMVMTGLIAR